MTNLTNIKNKIRALMNMTVANGATEAEAFSAMKIVGKLLEEYNISMDEFSVRKENCVTEAFHTKNKHMNEQVMTASYVAKFCSVKVWMNRTKTGIDIFFFGLEPDVQMALYLTNMIGNVYNNEFNAFKASDIYRDYNGHRRVMASNFQKGYASKINARLGAMMNEAKQQSVAQTGSTALVIVEKSKFVEEEFRKVGPKLVSQKSYSSSKYNAAARVAGENAGNKANLSRPLT
jgi:hypothetical protein